MVNRLNEIQDTQRLSFEALSNGDNACRCHPHTLCFAVNPYTLVWRKRETQGISKNEDKNKYGIKTT